MFQKGVELHMCARHLIEQNRTILLFPLVKGVEHTYLTADVLSDYRKR